MIPLRDSIPSRHPPVMTGALILVNAIVFLYELNLPHPQIQAFFVLFGIVPARSTDPAWAWQVGLPVGSYLTFLTSMFLHGGWMHLIGNMWTLWIFGDNVEDRMGKFRFLLFYLLCGALSGGVHALTHPDSTVPTVGASGAIAGVMGAYFLMFPRSRILMLFPLFFYPVFFTIPASLYLAYWFLAQVLSGTLSLAGPRDVGGVAWWAHGGGFATGALAHWIFVKRRAPGHGDARDDRG